MECKCAVVVSSDLLARGFFDSDSICFESLLILLCLCVCVIFYASEH